MSSLDQARESFSLQEKTDEFVSASGIYYLEVVTHNRRGIPFADGRTRIRFETDRKRLIQWVNDSQAAMLEQQYPGVVVWR